jgi:hypothetical protein
MSDFLLDDVFTDFLATEPDNDGIDRLIAEAAAEVAAGQPAAPTLTSAPVYTVELGPVTATVIEVNHDGRKTFQLYAIDDEQWSLVGLFGLFVDGLAEIRTWRRYLSAGGSLQTWLAEHPDGVRCDVSAVTK